MRSNELIPRGLFRRWSDRCGAGGHPWRITNPTPAAALGASVPSCWRRTQAQELMSVTQGDHLVPRNPDSILVGVNLTCHHQEA